MTDRIAIAVSGGVDSMVCAYLLKQQHNDVLGLHFITGYEKPAKSIEPLVVDLFQQMDIPVVIVDLRHEFRQQVVDYFCGAYLKGHTPNPCLVCNPMIKFGALLDEAKRHGASRLATGHYARVGVDPRGCYRLQKGLDRTKDQSYFLARLTQAQLARAVFPLGAWTKADVKTLAAQKGLRPIVPAESQDICFIHDASYIAFLIAHTGIRPEPGEIVDTQGHLVGIHNGLHGFTIGQRRGINCPASQAYYVVQKDVRRNRLVVGHKDQLCVDGCKVIDINWINGIPDGPLAIEARIRYRHRAVPAKLVPTGKDVAMVTFDEPQAAVTPGQGAVFYHGDAVIGGGWIVDASEAV
ncbi:tRNA-specific 2-thiouridylase MnmA [Desulfosarcina cetonica]|uniref:tRNA 2-thiouridine(34) synthase MnmA n=1 Tax=Desulfosarcina cetonica TaxID=90730 RepID=UPI0006D19177|nr:tRNA 2-thiouridine(34) synthase MnmA [Desulfosarcina cetonica]VTR64100.1 tRNA-specific 2-thiouridylase MnmA [Desulfosarcina cetonica]